MAFAIISGTGLYDLELMQKSEETTIKTPYGDVLLYHAVYCGQDVYFIPRHGKGHSVPPHLINYRAQMAALAMLGVREIMALCSVGSLDLAIPPGSLVFMDQFIDFTWGREHTFSCENAVGHIPMDKPYCPRLTQDAYEVAQSLGIETNLGGVYVATQGPRFETPAEIKAYATLGATVVGMTGVPETPLAREAGICYASLGVVGNYAAGLSGDIDLKKLDQIMAKRQLDLERILMQLIAMPRSIPDCACASSKLQVCKTWPFLK